MSIFLLAMFVATSMHAAPATVVGRTAGNTKASTNSARSQEQGGYDDTVRLRGDRNAVLDGIPTRTGGGVVVAELINIQRRQAVENSGLQTEITPKPLTEAKPATQAVSSAPKAKIPDFSADPDLPPELAAIEMALLETAVLEGAGKMNPAARGAGADRASDSRSKAPIEAPAAQSVKPAAQLDLGGGDAVPPPRLQFIMDKSSTSASHHSPAVKSGGVPLTPQIETGEETLLLSVEEGEMPLDFLLSKIHSASSDIPMFYLSSASGLSIAVAPRLQ